MSAAVGPCVGIWWLHGRTLIPFTRPIKLLRPEAGFTNYPHGHAAIWPFVQRRHAALRDKEYWEVPRGRVVHVAGDGRFNLFVPATLASSSEVADLLVQRYGLPLQRVLVLTDAHYDHPSRAAF